MKPNFALSLSFEGIRLLHRAAGGWREVGAVALDAQDMAGELAVLRRTASALEPSGVRCKLLIPEAQVKYLTIQTGDLSGDARRDAARKALDGATPYAVEELYFDVCADGEATHVAAVAQETLEEAESFAVDHRFHPVSFATVPDDADFAGEPYFGMTQAAASLLEPGEEVEPDGVAVVVIGSLAFPAASVDEPTEVMAPATDENVPDLADHDPALMPDDPSPEAEGPDTVEAPAALSEMAQAAPRDPALMPAPETDQPPNVDRLAPEQATSTDTPEPSGESVVAHADPAKSDGAATHSVQAARNDAAEAEPPSLPAMSRPVRNAPLPVDATPPPPPQPTAGAGFASRRTTQNNAAPGLQGATRRPDATAATGVIAASDPGLTVALQRRSEMKGDQTMARALASVDMSKAPLHDGEPIEPDSTSLIPPTTALAPTGKVRFLSRRGKTGKPPKPIPNALPKQAETPSYPVATSAVLVTEADRLTVFGARRTADVGGKPRFLGLVLTAALLLVLAAVAAWATVFLDDGVNLSRLFGTRAAPERETIRTVAAADGQILPARVAPKVAAPKPVQAPVVSPTVSEPAPQLASPAVEEAGTDVQIAALAPDLSAEDGAVLDALRTPAAPVQPLSELVVSMPSGAEEAAKYAATGIWAQAPDIPPEPSALLNLDDLMMTRVDPVSALTKVAALPSFDSFLSDLVVAAIAAPAAAGTQFALGENGLVVATAEGALSPDGVMVFAGRPGKVPPATLARLEAPQLAPEDAPPLARARPIPRPADLAKPDEPPLAELPAARPELAGVRPLLRPASVRQLAVEKAGIEEAAQVIDTTAAVTEALAVPSPFATASRFATTQSRRPDTRPRNFSKIVRRAEKLQAAAPKPTRVASAATAPQVVKPRIPTRTSVAKQATVKNAINLRKVNLIGVYGKPSRRRALVRLSNGRYQKVVVGDKIDGGRVSAIGDSELRYTKRGRDVVLKMPKS